MMIGETEVTTEYAALRAENLAKEIVVGWVDQTNLSGSDAELTTLAWRRYVRTIENGKAETQHADEARDIIFLHCQRLETEMDSDSLSLCWAETQIASRALKAFSERGPQHDLWCHDAGRVHQRELA